VFIVAAAAFLQGLLIGLHITDHHGLLNLLRGEFLKIPDIRSFIRMNKPDLIQALKDSNNLSRSEAEKIVTLFFR
jgi:hypothetical protein